MAEAEVVITAFHNRTKETVTFADQKKGHVKIEPGGDLKGSWVYTYDPDEKGTIPSPNEAWYVDSTTEFKWGTAPIHNPDA